MAADCANVPPAAIGEVHRQGELCLLGTIQFALAADQRATTMAGIFGAGSVALVAAIATVLAGATPNPALISGAATTAAFLFVGALFCARSGWPRDFFLPGYEPRKLAPAATDQTSMLRFASDDIQTRIDANRKALETSSCYLKIGGTFASLALPVGIGVALICPLITSFF